MGRYLEEEITDGPRYRAVHILAPGKRLFVIVNRHDQVNVVPGHAVDILVTRYRESLRRSELRMGMKITYLLQFTEPGEYRLYLSMILTVVFDALVPPVCRLNAEGMLNYEPVLEFIPEEEAKAFLLIYLRRT